MFRFKQQTGVKWENKINSPPVEGKFISVPTDGAKNSTQISSAFGAFRNNPTQPPLDVSSPGNFNSITSFGMTTNPTQSTFGVDVTNSVKFPSFSFGSGPLPSISPAPPSFQFNSSPQQQQDTIFGFSQQPLELTTFFGDPVQFQPTVTTSSFGVMPNSPQPLQSPFSITNQQTVLQIQDGLEIKCVIVGSGGVGKTTFLSRYVRL